MEPLQEPLGLRERNKAQRAKAIATAAATLFDMHGFDGVTTQAIARAAGVADGTVFRYAQSKTELLLMALNRSFAAALEDGLAHGSRFPAGDAVGRLTALAASLLAVGGTRPDNAALYQRELLFSPEGGEFVDEGVAISLRWEAAMTAPYEELLALTGRDPVAPAAAQGHTALSPARLAGSAAWDALQLTVARRPRHPNNPQELANLAGQFTLLARGLTRPEPLPTPATTQE